MFRRLPLINTLVSSAYNVLKNMGETLHISLIDQIKSSGPRIDQCGTPHLSKQITCMY